MTNEERMKKALIDIYNQTCIYPSDYDDAMCTYRCICDILEEVEHLFKDSE